MIVCELCGKKFKNAQGLRGHKTFVHGITGSKIPKTPAIQPASEQQLTSLEDRLSRLELIASSRDSLPDVISEAIEPLTQKLNNTTEQLAKISDTVSILNQDIRRNSSAIDTQKKDSKQQLISLEDRLSRLEIIASSRDSLTDVISEAIEPLTQKLNNTTEQLAKISDTVSILNQDIRRNSSAIDTQKKDYNQLLTNLQEAQSKLSTVINEHRDAFNKNLAVLESRIDQTQKLVEIPGDSEPLTQKLSNTAGQLAILSNTVSILSQDIGRNNATTDAQKKEFNQLLTNLQESHNRLVTLINEHRYTFNKNLEVMESRIDQTQKLVEIPGDPEPLTEKLSNTTEQLSKLSDIVNRLGQDIRRSETMTDVQQKEFSQLLTGLQEAQNKLATTITEHRDTFNKGLGILESRIENTQKMIEIPGDSEPLTLKLSNTVEQLNKLNEIIGKLEYVTGLKDTSANGIPIDSAPLSQRLNATAEQLNKFEDIVSRLSQDVRLNETTTNAQRKEFSQLLTNLQEANNRITAVMNGRDDTFDKNLEVLESRIDETQKMIETQGNIRPLTEQFNNTTDQVSKLNDIVNRLSQDIRLSNTATDTQKKEFSNELNNTSTQLAKLTTRLDKLDFITGLKDSEPVSAGSETLTQKLSNTNGQLKELTDIVTRLKFITGLTDSSLEDIEPLTQKLNNTSIQLVNLGEIVDKLSQDIRQSNNATDAQKKEFNEKLSNTTEQLVNLNDIIGRLSQDIKQNNAATDVQRKEFDDKLTNTAGQLAKFSELLSRLQFITGLKDPGPDSIIGDSEPLTHQLNNTTEQLNKLTDTVSKLKYITGLKESGSDDLAGDAEPLTQKLSNTAEQLNKLTDIVGNLSQDLKLNEVATDAQKKEFGQLLTNLQEAHNRLATAINEHHYAFNKNLEVLESRIDKTQKMVEIPGDAETLTQKVSNITEQLNKLTDTVNKLSQGISLSNAITDGQRNEFSAKLNSTAEELIKIGGIINKLTSITGLGDSASAEIPGSAEPLTRKLSNITDQLKKLTNTVDKLSQDISLGEAITDGQRKEINNKFNSTSEELMKINGTINKLVSITGLVDSDSTEMPVDAEPLTQKVKNATEQLAKISDIVSRLSQDIKLSNTATEAQKKEFSQLLTNLQESDLRLTAIVNEHRDVVNKNLEVLESRIDETQEMVEIPGDSESLPQKLTGVIEQLIQLTNRLDKLDSIIGLKDIDSAGMPGNTEPLTQKLNNMTGQLSKLGDIVHKLSQDIRLSDNTTDAQRKEFNNKLSSTSAELIKISGIVSRLEFITGLGNADLTDIPGESEPLTQKLSNTAEQLAKLSDTVNKLKFTTGLRDSGPDDISGSVIPLIQKLNNTTEQLNKLTEMVGRLEFITGLKDSSPDNIPEGAEPLTQRLTNTTGQLNKLSEMVGRLSQDIKLSDTTTDAQRKEFGSKLNNTVEQLSRVNNRLDKLDIVTGIKESGPNNLPGNPEPLNKKLINTTEQLSKLNELVNKLSQDVSMSNVITDSQRKGFNNKLSSTNEQLVKLSDIVSKLSQDIKQSETATDAQKKEFSQLLTNLQEAQKRLVATIEEHHIAFNKDLELRESRIENTLGIPGDNEPLSQKLSNTNEQLAKLSNIVGKLEFVIGFKDDDSAGIPVDAEPLTRKLNNTAEQLNKLTDMVGKLSQDVIASETTTNAQRQEFSDRLNNTTEQLVKINDIVGKLSEDIGQTNTATDAQKKEFSESLTNLQEAQSRLAAVIDEHRDTIKKNLEGLESRIDKTQKIIEGLGETQNENKPKPTPDGLDSLSLIPQLKTGLERVGEQITSLQAGVAKAQALAVRTPTDDLVIINMANGTKHTFRIYRGKRGLSKPHRVGVDQVHGEKYVDLSEPED